MPITGEPSLPNLQRCTFLSLTLRPFDDVTVRNARDWRRTGMDARRLSIWVPVGLMRIMSDRSLGEWLHDREAPKSRWRADRPFSGYSASKRVRLIRRLRAPSLLVCFYDFSHLVPDIRCHELPSLTFARIASPHYESRGRSLIDRRRRTSS